MIENRCRNYTIDEFNTIHETTTFKNCPFCGSIAGFIPTERDDKYGQIFCFGPSCFVCTPYGNYEKCKSIWNNRVDFGKQLLEWL